MISEETNSLLRDAFTLASKADMNLLSLNENVVPLVEWLLDVESRELSSLQSEDIAKLRTLITDLSLTMEDIVEGRLKAAIAQDRFLVATGVPSSESNVTSASSASVGVKGTQRKLKCNRHLLDG